MVYHFDWKVIFLAEGSKLMKEQTWEVEVDTSTDMEEEQRRERGGFDLGRRRRRIGEEG